MSSLNTKINSYSLETGIEFNEAYNLPPTQTGTDQFGTWTLSGVTPIYESTVGPIGGAGSWKLESSIVGNCRVRATTGLTKFNDQDYTMGMWFKSNTTVPVGQAGIPILTIQPFQTNGYPGISFAYGPSVSGLNQTIGFSVNGLNYNFLNIDCAVGTWNYLAVRKTVSGGNTYTDIFINGNKVDSFNYPSLLSTTTTSINFGQVYQGIDFSGNYANFHVAPSSVLTEAAITEIYRVGAGIIDNSIAATPVTASALMTEPTLAFTFNDHSEVFTSITASSEMVNPFYVGTSQNISITANVLDSTSADIGTHNIITSSSIIYPAQQMNSTNAEILNPVRFGPDSVTISVLPMTADNAILQGSVSITINYQNYVLSQNPIMYIRDFSGGNAVINNEGSLNFGTVDKGPVGTSTWTLSEQPSGVPLSYVGNGTSPTVGTPGTSNSQRLVWNDETYWGSTLANIIANKAYTFDFWYKPTTNSANITWDFYVHKFTISTTSNSTSIYWNIADGVNSTTSLEPTFTLTPNLLSMNNWHNIVITVEPSGSNIQYKLYIDGNIVTTRTYDFTYTLANLLSYATQTNAAAIITLPTAASGDAIDELAFFNKTLSASDILTKYSLVANFSPNKTIVAGVTTASALIVDPIILRSSNINFPQTSITASSELVNPVIVARQNISNLSIPLTASGESIDPFFYGNPDARITTTAMTAYAETSQNNFALDGTYYSYVMANILPYRYVTFDGSDALYDYGSDHDYSVTPTSVGGTITTPLFGINNASAKTSGQSYTDGVVLRESEWNDTWGTGNNQYHSAFWFEQSADDTSTDGLRVLWNVNGNLNNQHAVIYHYQNKLHFEINNQSGTHITLSSTNDINLFDYNRHFIVINSHFNNNHNYITVYVDGVSVISGDIGTYVITTVNSSTSLVANDETYNYPRLGVGCLITPFAYTALPAIPVNTKLYIDEVHWAKTQLLATAVTNLYNAMPNKINNYWNADFMIGSTSTLVNPLVGVGNGQIAEFATASGEMIDSSLYLEFNNIINVEPMTASINIVEPTYFADDITNLTIHADIMFASSLMLFEQITISVPGTTMQASATMRYTGPYMDPYRLLILSQQYKMYGDFTFDDILLNHRYKHIIGDID